jgi:hypothetical protein
VKKSQDDAASRRANQLDADNFIEPGVAPSRSLTAEEIRRDRPWLRFLLSDQTLMVPGDRPMHRDRLIYAPMPAPIMPSNRSHFDVRVGFAGNQAR